jgi:glycosyltransferase involved in cell wall biosynthesis
MPKISVVIPVYNGAKTIQETIQSVLQQTFTDFEIIAIDDGSQDETVEVVKSIGDPRVQIFSYPNGGLAESRNRGIARARGEFIAFLDADDLWTPDKLEAQLKALEANPKVAVAYSWTDYIDEHSQFLYSGRHGTFNGDVYAQLLIDNFLENGSNPLIRKQALTEVGGFDSSINTAADWDMWLRLAKHFYFVAVAQPQILYRVSTRSMSANILNQEAQCLKAIDRAFEQAPESLKSLKQQSLINLYKYLTFKALEGYPSRKNGMAAMRCFWNYLRWNPVLFKQPRVIAGIILRILAMFVLSPKQFRRLFATP